MPLHNVSLQESYVVIITSDFQQIHSLIGIPVSYHPDLALGLSLFPQFPQMPTLQRVISFTEDLLESLHHSNQTTCHRMLDIPDCIYMSFHYLPLPPDPGFHSLLIAPLAVPIPHTILLDAFPMLLSLSSPFYSPPTANFCSIPNQQLVFLELS